MLNTPKYSGEPTPQALASGLATLGRYGDEYMIHAAEGETVIPPEVFESNPQLKADLFRQMAMMGIKDPNRYVVGNSLNSINPLTGQPEFFFKKIFKTVKKVFKKALPIIAPIVGNLILPGWGGMIASGLVTKLQGGSWGDVLKGAAISGIGSLAMGGLSGAMSGGAGGISSGMTGAFANPFSAASYGTGWNPLSGEMPWNASGTQTSLSNLTGSAPSISGVSGGIGSAGSAGEFVGGNYVGGGASVGAAPSGIASVSGPIGSSTNPFTSASISNVPSMGTGVDLDVDMFAGPATATTLKPVKLPELGTFENPYINQPPAPVADSSVGADFGPVSNEAVNTNLNAAGLNTTVESTVSNITPEQDFFGKMWDSISPENAAARQLSSTHEAFKAKVDILNAGRALDPNLAPLTQGDVSKMWVAKLGKMEPPGFIETYGRIGAVAGAGALGIAALSGAFTEEEAEFNAKPNKSEIETTAYDKWREVSDKNSPEAQGYFNTWNGPAYLTRSQYEKQTGGRSAWADWRFLPEGSDSNTGYDQTMGQSVGLLPADFRVSGAAMGGEVVGPGTGTSDSIPARLSDGEFVMTANAVQNAGGGNRDLGAARMYDMMRRFEGGVA